MTRSEELSMTLRAEYLFYQRYMRWQYEGRLTGDGEIRLRNTIKAIRNAKNDCREELMEEEYPEEYYYDDPEEFQVQKGEKLTTINKTEILQGDGTQMNIYDFLIDGEIRWR